MYRFEPNAQKAETLTIRFDGAKCHYAMTDGQGEHTLECSADGWTEGSGILEGVVSRKVAARGIWTADDTYTITQCFYETPYVQTATFKFDGDQVTLIRKRNVAFGPTESTPLVGRS
jgi:hypothetical protein